jgi:hypothetical protein
MDSDYIHRMNEFHDAHGGVMQACIVRREHVPLMLASAVAGNTDNHVILYGLETWVREAERRKKSDRMLCLDCDITFHPRRMPDAFLVVIPFAATTGHAMVTGICRRCADRDDAALSTAALGNLRSIYPDATFAQAGQA